MSLQLLQNPTMAITRKLVLLATQGRAYRSPEKYHWVFQIEWLLEGRGGQPLAHAPRVEHWLLRNGALYIADDKKVSHFYSLILVILHFSVLSGIALFLLDHSGFTVVKVISFR